MNFHEIQNLSSPFDNEDAANKYYIDTNIKSAIDDVKNAYLKLDGTSNMSGNKDMHNHKIINVLTPKNDDEVATKKYVDTKTSSIHQSDGDLDLKEKYNIINSKQQSFTYLASHYDNLVSYNGVKDIFLSGKESFPMETTLNMKKNLMMML